jgi:transketolase
MTQAQPMVFLVDVDDTLLAAHLDAHRPRVDLVPPRRRQRGGRGLSLHRQLRHRPAAITLSRQPLPTFDRSRYASAEDVARGAYVMADPPKGSPEIILIASGGEVAIAVGAYETLTAEGLRVRVVSMSSWDVFEEQPQSYRDSVLPPPLSVRIAIEQSSVIGWDRYVGPARRRV